MKSEKLKYGLFGLLSIFGLLSLSAQDYRGNVLETSTGYCSVPAALAAALETARTINGTSFDGTANITVTAAAGTLTGATLASGVTASSLTSVGTIATGVWDGTDVAVSAGGTGANTLTGIIVGNGTSAMTAVAGTASQYLRRNAGNTNYEFATISGGGDALVANPLSQFAATTSAQLMGVISDETGGSGVVVGSASPTFTGQVSLAAATTTTSPLNIPSGTVETTSEAGDALEYDGNAFYASSDADNRGYIPVVYIIRADATRTFANVGTAQTIFTTPTNGRLTLETGTYIFDGFLALTSMSATSGNLSFNPLGAGTATMAAILYQTYGNDAAANATAAAGGSMYSTTAASSTNVVTAGTQTAVGFAVKGTFEITGAGTIIPSITLTTANAAVLSIGSYLQFTRVGSTSLTVVGQWN